jgi:hypothetical protein
MMYQETMCRTARELGFEVLLYRRGEEAARAAERLGVTAHDIESFVTSAGRRLGPPGTQEHRQAFAAGILALAVCTRATLRIPRAES